MRFLLWLGVGLGAVVATVFGAATISLLVSGEMAAFVMAALFTAVPTVVVWKCLSRLRQPATATDTAREVEPREGWEPPLSQIPWTPPPSPPSVPPPVVPPAARAPSERHDSLPRASEDPPFTTPVLREHEPSADKPIPRPAPAKPPLAVQAAEAGKRVPRVRRTGIQQVHLTRKGSGRPAVAETFVALDLETTGLDPARDEAVEVGAVRFTGDGEVIDEFATLVAGPRSSVEARSYHGIEEEDRVDAPGAAEVWSELLHFLAGSVLVAHNLEFERGFLQAAARRHKLPVPDVPALCTLVECRRHFDGKTFSLKSLHRHATGTWRDDTHQALGDARATMDLLLWMIRTSPAPLLVTGDPPFQVGPPQREPCLIRCRPAPLRAASVAAVLEALPRSPLPRSGDVGEVTKYRALLNEVLDDGRLTYDEAQALAAQAVRTGLTGTQLKGIHGQVFDEAFPDADGPSLQASRLRQMSVTAEALGLAEVASAVRERLPVEETPAQALPPLLRGRRYAFVGESEAVTSLRQQALAHGAPEVKNITKTVIWVATDDPESPSRPLSKALALQIPILPVESAAALLQEDISVAEQDRFEREQRLAASEARMEQFRLERAKQQEEEDAFWRPTWRRREHKDDPGPPEW